MGYIKERTAGINSIFTEKYLPGLSGKAFCLKIVTVVSPYLEKRRLWNCSRGLRSKKLNGKYKKQL